MEFKYNSNLQRWELSSNGLVMLVFESIDDTEKTFWQEFARNRTGLKKENISDNPSGLSDQPGDGKM